MNVFTRMQRKYTEKRFLRNDLNIIQNIQTDNFHHIIEVLVAAGWEVSIDYRGREGWEHKGSCKLRKGTSVLECNWSRTEQGTITGLGRIIKGVAIQFDLVSLDTPHWQDN